MFYIFSAKVVVQSKNLYWFNSLIIISSYWGLAYISLSTFFHSASIFPIEEQMKWQKIKSLICIFLQNLGKFQPKQRSTLAMSHFGQWSALWKTKLKPALVTKLNWLPPHPQRAVGRSWPSIHPPYTQGCCLLLRNSTAQTEVVKALLTSCLWCPWVVSPLPLCL